MPVPGAGEARGHLPGQHERPVVCSGSAPVTSACSKSVAGILRVTARRATSIPLTSELKEASSSEGAMFQVARVVGGRADAWKQHAVKNKIH